MRGTRVKVMVCGGTAQGGVAAIRALQAHLREGGFEVLDQFDWGKEAEAMKIPDFRRRPKLCREVMEWDIELLRAADIIVTVYNTPSYGAAVESYVARELGKKVVLLAEGAVPSPWPVALSDRVVEKKDDLIPTLLDMTNSTLRVGGKTRLPRSRKLNSAGVE